MKGFVLKKLVFNKAVQLPLIAILLAVPAIFLSGCSAGQVVAPFNPKEVKVEPYNPDPEWSDRNDTQLTSIESMKRVSGQATAPGATATSATTAGSTNGSASGSANGTPGGVTPGSGTGTPPEPVPPATRVPSTSDPVYGFVWDRVEGGLVTNAIVSLKDKRGVVLDTFTTGADGMYSFPKSATFPDGYYQVSVLANGYAVVALSTAQFYKPLLNNRIDLDLAYANPWEQLLGGNFNASGAYNNGFTGSPGDVVAINHYIGSVQNTAWGALFIRNLAEGWVEYTFQLPPPESNNYVIDGLYLTFPSSEVVDATTGVWKTGGYVLGYFYDCYTSSAPGDGETYWIPLGSTIDSLTLFPLSTAVDFHTGIVKVRVRADEAANAGMPFFLTNAKLAYDYHKVRHAKPVVTNQTATYTSVGVDIPATLTTPVLHTSYVEFAFDCSESGRASILLVGPATAPHPSMPRYKDFVIHAGHFGGLGSRLTFVQNYVTEPALAAIPDSQYLAPGIYHYSITVTNQTGETSMTGPFTFTVADHP